MAEKTIEAAKGIFSAAICEECGIEDVKVDMHQVIDWKSRSRKPFWLCDGCYWA